MYRSAYLLLLALPLLAHRDEPSDPAAIFKSGDYVRAIPLLQQSVAKSPKDAVLQAELLSALVYEGRVDEAADAADEDAQNFPQSADVLAARGEFAFYMGDMPQAAALFNAALKVNGENARATYGVYEIAYASSMYRTARLLCMRAHQLDPDDALISLAFSRYLVGQKREEFLPDFIRTHPWFFKRAQQMQQNTSEVRQELNGRKIFELDGPREEVTIPIHNLQDGPRLIGQVLKVSIEGGKPLSLVLDTGASGILLTQAAVDKAGLSHLGSTEVRGIGDKGARGAFFAIAESCAIEKLKYKTCMLGATEGKKGVAAAEDGLIGTDVFSDYIVTIDFQRHTLHLLPLPDRPPNPQGYDRDPLPTEAGFTPVFRFGHHLYISTKVNQKSTGLFLLDTGSSLSAIDSTFARLTSKISRDERMHVTGVSGSVSQVFEADKAELQFARFRQRNLGLTSFNLNNSPEHQPVRMDGILGFPVLVMFRLSLDYRNGLINFDYVLDRR